MGFTFPVGIKDAWEQVPQGYIAFNIDSVEDGLLGKEGDEVKGIQVMLTVTEPAECVRIIKEEKFYLGLRETDKRVQSGKVKADREADNPETLIITLSRFKAFAHAAGVDIEGQDSEQIYSQLKNRQVLGRVEHKILPARPGEVQSDLPFAQVAKWLPIGTMDPHVTQEAVTQPATKGAASAPRAAAPAPSPAPTPAMAKPIARRLAAR